ncbi:MAG: hypothetical protein IIY02_03175 [Firmicutes bacterium]|nr:hypothetical protein [Bacillota bacterium]
MESIKAKLKEYLAMDHELAFGEFNEYYNEVMAELNGNYQGYDAENLLSMRYVLSTVCINAQNWSLRKDKNAKKYKKIADKTRFWVDAITYKLTKELGYTNDMIDDAEEKIDAEMRPQED